MERVFDVANYLVYLSYTDGEQEPMTTMKLQKMLYYAQGLSLAKRGVPLFSERIKAWRDGPVVPVVWHEFKQYGVVIPCKDERVDLSIDTRVFLRQIWKLYGQYTGDHLSKMTHAEAPWKGARQGLPDDATSDAEVTQESLNEFFSGITVELPAVPRPVELRKGREVYRLEDAGQVLPSGI